MTCIPADSDSDPPLECEPELVITAGQLCSGTVGGLDASCFALVPVSGQSYCALGSPGDPILAEFQCECGDPCAASPSATWCTAVLDETVEVASAQGACTPETIADLCGDAAAAQATETLYDTRTVEEAVADALETVDPECPGFDIDVGSTCSSQDFTEAVLEDTGMGAADAEEASATYLPDLVFLVDPAVSTISITGTDSQTDTVHPHGYLLALTNPARFMVGFVYGGAMTVEGGTWTHTMATFDAPMTLSISGSNFTLGTGQLDEIAWGGKGPNATTKTWLDVGPSQPAAGEFDLGNGTWEVSFTQTVSGRVIVVELGGDIVVP